MPSSLSRVSWCRDASNCSLAYPLWRLRTKRCVSFLAAQSHCLLVELLVAVHQGQVEGACRECPGYCKDFLATWKVGLSPLLHAALEIQEVVRTLPKVMLYFELLQNAPLHYTFNQSSTWPLYEQNQISEMTPLMTGFPQHFKKKPLTLTLQTSLIS